MAVQQVTLEQLNKLAHIGLVIMPHETIVQIEVGTSGQLTIITKEAK